MRKQSSKSAPAAISVPMAVQNAPQRKSSEAYRPMQLGLVDAQALKRHSPAPSRYRPFNDSDWVSKVQRGWKDQITELEPSRGDWLKEKYVALYGSSPDASAFVIPTARRRSSETKKAIHSTQPGQSLASRATRIFSGLSNKMHTRRIEKYLSQLETFIQAKEIALGNVNLDAQNIKRIARAVIPQLRHSGRAQLIPSYRSYLHHRLCACDLQRAILESSIDLIRVGGDVIHKLMESACVQTSELDEQLLEAPSVLLDKSPTIQRDRALLKSLWKRIAQIEKMVPMHGFVPRETPTPSHKERRRYIRCLLQHLCRILNEVQAASAGEVVDCIAVSNLGTSADTEERCSSAASSMTWSHDLSKTINETSHLCMYRFRSDFDQLQHRFDQFLMDERFKEGRVLKRWMELYRTEEDTLPACAIVDFVNYCTSTLITDYSLHESEVTRIHGLVQGLLFAKCTLPFFKRQIFQSYDQNAQFRHNVNWLRQCPPESLDIDAKFLTQEKGENMLYQKAIAHIEVIDYLWVPGDMLLCIYETAQLIYEEASVRSGLDVHSIGADYLLPLFVWVTINATLAHPHAILRMLKLFCTEAELQSELGYYMACWEGAVTFISQADPEDFRAHVGEVSNRVPTHNIHSQEPDKVDHEKHSALHMGQEREEMIHLLQKMETVEGVMSELSW